jgi:hypothetical protein
MNQVMVSSWSSKDYGALDCKKNCQDSMVWAKGACEAKLEF